MRSTGAHIIFNGPYQILARLWRDGAAQSDVGECHTVLLEFSYYARSVNKGIVILEMVRFVAKVTNRNGPEMLIKDVTVFYSIYITVNFTQSSHTIPF